MNQHIIFILCKGTIDIKSEKWFLSVLIKIYEAWVNKILGHLLQLIPFFLYLLQHLLFGLIQLDAHALSQVVESEITECVLIFSL